MGKNTSNDIFFLKELERKLSSVMLDEDENNNADNLNLGIDDDVNLVFNLYKNIFSDLKSACEICRNEKNEFFMKKIRFSIERLENINNCMKDQLEKYCVSDKEPMTLDENTYRIRFGYPYGENGIDDAEFYQDMESMIRIGENLTEYGRDAIKRKDVGKIINFEYSIVFLQLDLYNVFGIYVKISFIR